MILSNVAYEIAFAIRQIGLYSHVKFSEINCFCKSPSLYACRDFVQLKSSTHLEQNSAAYRNTSVDRL